MEMPALRGHSNNKFLYSAVVPLKSAGPSELMISVRTALEEALLSCQVEVRPPLPPALAFWPWLVFPPDRDCRVRAPLEALATPATKARCQTRKLLHPN